MNFESMTAEQVRDSLPQKGENQRWEWKSGTLLAEGKKHELKKMLGKQISAFANTGGGHLIIGIDDHTRELEFCEPTRGRQAMRDYIHNLVHQSVDYPLQAFQVFQLRSEHNAEQCIILVQIEDSPAAPHQSSTDKTYYWRLDGSSLPAPHFHLELLRNRHTRSVIQILHDITICIADDPVTLTYCPRINLNIRMTLKNASLQATSACGVLVRTRSDNYCWSVRGKEEELPNGVCILATNQTVFPSATTTCEIPLCSTFDHDPHSYLDQLELEFTAASHNYLAQPIKYKPDPIKRREIHETLKFYINQKTQAPL